MLDYTALLGLPGVLLRLESFERYSALLFLDLDVRVMLNHFRILLLANKVGLVLFENLLLRRCRTADLLLEEGQLLALLWF